VHSQFFKFVVAECVPGGLLEGLEPDALISTVEVTRLATSHVETVVVLRVQHAGRHPSVVGARVWRQLRRAFAY
jgi:hypothetical protein